MIMSVSERISDVSEHTTYSDITFLGNASMYAGVPSTIKVFAYDLCDKLVTSTVATFELTTSDGYIASRIANSSTYPTYFQDIAFGPGTAAELTIKLLVGGLSTNIYGSPMFVQVLPGPVNATKSYIDEIDNITTAETGSATIYWVDEFGSRTALVCNHDKRHILPIGEGFPPWPSNAVPSSNCRDGKNEHGSVFSVEFFNESGANVGASFSTGQAQSSACSSPGLAPVLAPSCAIGTTLTYATTVPGIYFIHVSHDNQLLAGAPPGRPPALSPFPIEVQPGPTAINKCYAVGAGASDSRAGTPTQFVIKLADTYGNVKSPLKVRSLSPSVCFQLES